MDIKYALTRINFTLDSNTTSLPEIKNNYLIIASDILESYLYKKSVYTFDIAKHQYCLYQKNDFHEISTNEAYFIVKSIRNGHKINKNHNEIEYRKLIDFCVEKSENITEEWVLSKQNILTKETEICATYLQRTQAKERLLQEFYRRSKIISWNTVKFEGLIYKSPFHIIFSDIAYKGTEKYKKYIEYSISQFEQLFDSEIPNYFQTMFKIQIHLQLSKEL